MSKLKSLRIEGIIVQLALAVVWVSFCHCGTTAASYSFSLDRFDITGNLPGSASDEFDNGEVAPWTVYDPTVIEADGVLTFKNPGTIVPWDTPTFSGYGEMSYVASGHHGVPYPVQNGAGNFTATSEWIMSIPSPGQLFAMHLSWDIENEPERHASEGLWLWNVAPWEADFFGIPSGLNLIWGYDETQTGFNVDAVPLEASDITGNIIFELSFDDTSNELTCRFSLNSGSSFSQPFLPIVSRFPEGFYGDFILGAESHHIIPAPGAVLLGSIGVGLVGWLRRRRAL